MSVPYQKIVGVNKEPCDRSHIYTCMNNNAMSAAALALNKASTFKLWVYFAMNRDGYEFELSARAVTNFCGITEKTYREAVKELISKGYLVQRGEGSNHYDFYEIPRVAEVPEDGSIVTCHTSTYWIEE